MYIKNLWASIVYKGIFVVLCAAALIIDFGFVKGDTNWYILNYYTILSNIACLVFFAMAHLRLAKALKAGAKEFACLPRVEGAVVFAIAVTGIVYATMLAPADIAAGRFYRFPNIVLHYVVPSMAILDWLLFSPKGRFRACDPLLWLCVPLTYFGYILLRSTFAGNIGPTDSRFPYAFIDPAVQGGWDKMFAGVGVITLCMLALSYLIWLIDTLVVRAGKRRVTSNGQKTA